MGTVFGATMIPRNGINDFLDRLGLACLVFGAFILCGASPVTNLLHTALASIYMTTLATFNIVGTTNEIGEEGGAEDGKDTRDDKLCSKAKIQPLRYRFFQSLQGPLPLASITTGSRCSAIITQLTVATTIPFQILLLYDRGWQAQRWPVPIILGSTCGWLLGTVLAAFACFVAPAENETRKNEE